MVTIPKIIDGVEMVDDMTDCYYNPEKDEIFLSNIGEYEDLTEDEIDELFEASIILPTQHEINEYQIMVDFIETIDNLEIKNNLQRLIQRRKEKIKRKGPINTQIAKEESSRLWRQSNAGDSRE